MTQERTRQPAKKKPKKKKASQADTDEKQEEAENEVQTDPIVEQVDRQIDHSDIDVDDDQGSDDLETPEQSSSGSDQDLSDDNGTAADPVTATTVTSVQQAALQAREAGQTKGKNALPKALACLAPHNHSGKDDMSTFSPSKRSRNQTASPAKESSHKRKNSRPVNKPRKSRRRTRF